MSGSIINEDERELSAEEIEAILQDWWLKQNPGAKNPELKAFGLLSRVYVTVRYEEEVIPQNGGNQTGSDKEAADVD